ncbi:MAG: hypothetical protein LBR40_05425 [Bacilli bacterium]|jgi:hypothetical protein|nr:hypothetical protein [Bacilli bacterium]
MGLFSTKTPINIEQKKLNQLLNQASNIDDSPFTFQTSIDSNTIVVDFFLNDENASFMIEFIINNKSDDSNNCDEVIVENKIYTFKGCHIKTDINEIIEGFKELADSLFNMFDSDIVYKFYSKKISDSPIFIFLNNKLISSIGDLKINAKIDLSNTNIDTDEKE